MTLLVFFPAAARARIVAAWLDALAHGFQRFKKAFMERALGAEMAQHLGYKAGEAKPEGTANHRNGKAARRY